MKRLFGLIAFTVCLSFLASACTVQLPIGGDETNTDTETLWTEKTDLEQPSDTVWAVKNGAPQFTVIYGDTDNSDSADYLANTLKSKTGVAFSIGRNPELNEGAKIYVGLHSSVEGMYELYGDIISYNGYGTVFKDGDIYICGYNSTTVSKAVKKFLSEITTEHVVKKEEAYFPQTSFTLYNPKYEIKEPMLLGRALSDFSVARGTNELAIKQLVDMCVNEIGTASGAYLRVAMSVSEGYRIELVKDSGIGLLDYTISTEGNVVRVCYGGVCALYAAFDRLISLLGENTAGGISINGNAKDTVMKDAPLKREDDTDIRVMSFNLLGDGLEMDYQCSVELRSVIAAEYILTFAPDSIGFQEFNSGNRAKLIPLISEKYSVIEFKDKENGGRMKYAGVGTAYLKDKYELIDSNAVHIRAEKYSGDPGAQDYYFTWAVLKDVSTGEQYIHANLHLDYRNENADDGRSLQLMQCEKINAELQLVRAKYPDAVIAMSGDYNSRLDSDVFVPEKGGFDLKCASVIAPEGKRHDDRLSYHDLCVYSNNVSGTNNAIDHVLVSDATAEVKRHSIVSDSIICHASDHYPVVVDIERK